MVSDLSLLNFFSGGGYPLAVKKYIRVSALQT
jgi:hypothetical protein